MKRTCVHAARFATSRSDSASARLRASRRSLGAEPGITPVRGSLRRFGAGALCLLAGAACSAAPAPVAQTAPAQPLPAQMANSEIAAEAGTPSCPRLPRASRIWTGFAADVPAAAPLHLTLDAVVPIQQSLGALFCGAEREPCRPAALLSIELKDAEGRSARVELDTGGPAPSVLQVRLLNETWQAEPESLAALLAVCRAARPAGD